MKNNNKKKQLKKPPLTKQYFSPNTVGKDDAVEPVKVGTHHKIKATTVKQQR